MTSSDRSLEDRVQDFIRANSLLEPGDKVLVAVSAGLDSMVLLEILHRLAPRLGFSLAAAYFDHGLRGSLTEQEAALVRARCGSMGIPFATARAGPGLAGRGSGGSLQAAARAARYAFLWESAEKLGCRRLATGHHRDDQAETVLMRLLKGSGLTGLAGIRPASLSGRLIRPLLGLWRNCLEQFARENAIPWREDPTNLTDKYFRNRLRHRMIPDIERNYDSSFSENLAFLAEEAAGLLSQLDRMIEPLLEKGVLRLGRDRLELLCSAAAQLPALIRRRLIVRGVFHLTGGELILSGRPLNIVERLAVKGASGRSADLPTGLRAKREFDCLAIFRRQTVTESPPGEDRPIPGPGKTYYEFSGVHWEITCEEGGNLLPDEAVAESAWRANAAFRELFDLDRLSLPLSIGRWRSGERIRPYGLGGSKKLKKVFLEKRIPQSRRDEIPVIRDAGGRVVWVCGVVRSDIAPLVARTGRVLALSASRCLGGEQDAAGGNDH